MNIPTRIARHERLRTAGGRYEIVVEARLGPRWSGWFEGFELVEPGDGTTVLRGAVSDQAALFGALGRIRDMGVALVSVRRLADSTDVPTVDG